MVGVWVVNPKTFVPFPTGGEEQMPADFRAFALKLNEDKTFEALHVPAHFFFYEWPAHAQLHGKWKLAFNSRDDVYYFSLDFAANNDSGAGGMSTVLYWRNRDKTWNPPQDLLIRMDITPHPGDPHGAMQFGLSKQK